MKRTLAALLVVFLVLAVLAGQVYRRSQATARGQVYTTREATFADLTVLVKGSGTLAAAEKLPLRAGVTGTVIAVEHAEGQLVSAGDVLVRLANESLRLQVEQSRLALDAAKEKLAAMLSPPTASQLRAAELKVRAAEQAWDARRSDVVQLEHRAGLDGTVASLRVTVGEQVVPGMLLATINDEEELLVTVPVSQEDINWIEPGQRAEVSLGHLTPVPGRVVAVGREGSGTAKVTFPVDVQLENPGHLRPGMLVNVRIYGAHMPPVGGSGYLRPRARHELRASVPGRVVEVAFSPGEPVQAGERLILLENDGLVLALAQAENALEMERLNYENLLSATHAPQFSALDVQAQEQKVRQEELTLESRLADLDQLNIRAPISGVVVAKNVNLGDKVAVNQVICTLADYSSMRVTISVDELDIDLVQVGQAATVTVPALPDGAWDAVVTRVATEGTARDGVSSYEVVLAIPGPGRLRAAMTANVSIFIGEKKDVLVVPVEAVRYQSGRKVVYVLQDGQAQAVRVETGVTTSDRVEIISGLTGGELVITSQVTPASAPSGRLQLLPFRLPSPIRR